jgi:hypothetical protein
MTFILLVKLQAAFMNFAKFDLNATQPLFERTVLCNEAVQMMRQVGVGI